MGNVLSVDYIILTKKDKCRMSSWKTQKINCEDWIKTLLDYNCSIYCHRCLAPFFTYRNGMTSKVLDHDHSVIYNNIRGVICFSCNASLRHIDIGVMPDFFPHYINSFEISKK